MTVRLSKGTLIAVVSLAVLLIASIPPSQGAEKERAASSLDCRSATAPALTALDELRAKLLTGLSYDGFVDEVRELRKVVGAMPVGQMNLACLQGAAGLAAGVFNEYTYAVAAWGECIARRSCDLRSNQPVIERKFWVAGLFIDEAHAALQ